MSSANGDEPSRSPQAAPKWLLRGVGKGLAPSPLSLFSDTIIINVSARLSTGKSQVFSLASGNPRDLLSCQNADAVRHALATADAAGRSALPAVRRPTVKRSARQNDPRRQNLMPRHVAAPPFCF